MAGRKVRNEADARRCLSAAKASGGSELAWARAHGVDARSLRAWRLNLARRGSGQRGLRLVELVAAPAASALTAHARYTLSVRDVRVEFDDTCSVETLARIVRALRAC